MLTYIFTLEIRDICANNVLTKTADIAQVTNYIIGTADLTITPLFTTNVPVLENCISTANLLFFNQYFDTYMVDNTGAGSPKHSFVKTFSTSNGILTVNTADIPTYSI